MAENLIIKLKISPNASKNEIIKTDEIVKVKVTAQPIENKANKALIEFLSIFNILPQPRDTFFPI